MITYTYSDLARSGGWNAVVIQFNNSVKCEDTRSDNYGKEMKDICFFHFDRAGDSNCMSLLNLSNTEEIQDEIAGMIMDKTWDATGPASKKDYLKLHNTCSRFLHISLDMHSSMANYVLEFLTEGYIDIVGESDEVKQKVKEAFKDLQVGFVE